MPLRISYRVSALVHHRKAHRAGGSLDHAHGGLDARGVEVRHLDLGDFTNLLLRDLRDLVAVRNAGSLLRACRFHEQVRRGRRLGNEGEGAIRIHRDLDRNDGSDLSLGARVELLHELHDVDAVLTERGTHRRCRVGLACRHLEFDETSDFLCHSGLVALQLRVIELHAGRAAEETDFDLYLALVVVDFLYGTGEVRERTLGDLHNLADTEWNFFLRLQLCFRGREAEDLVDLFVAQRLRLIARADKLDDALNVVDRVRGALIRLHLHEHIARIETTRH